MNKLRELYEQLYNQAYQKLEDNQRASVFACMASDDYLGKNVRFLLVGRAPNGWDFSGSKSDFIGMADSIFDQDNWKWVSDNGEKLFVVQEDNSNYYLSRSPFWNYSREIYRKISEDYSARWIDNIAWSNLYKIAPQEGNPDNYSRELQRKAGVCDILIQEIDLLKPTHILFVTGYDWIFPEILDMLSISRNTSYVIASGNYMNANVIVTCRPEYKNKDAYVKEILNVFGQLEKNVSLTTNNI